MSDPLDVNPTPLIAPGDDDLPPIVVIDPEVEEEPRDPSDPDGWRKTNSADIIRGSTLGIDGFETRIVPN